MVDEGQCHSFNSAVGTLHPSDSKTGLTFKKMDFWFLLCFVYPVSEIREVSRKGNLACSHTKKCLSQMSDFSRGIRKR